MGFSSISLVSFRCEWECDCEEDGNANADAEAGSKGGEMEGGDDV